MITPFITDALYKLYPQIVSTNGDNAYDAEGNKVAYDLQAVTTQAQKEACEAKAKELIASSDWSVLPDVNIANKTEFVQYRVVLRNIIFNPEPDSVFPVAPKPVWTTI